ncbi:MAG: hypothetical protein BWY36_00712 [Candidatus Diapherotrites archaeon ADurb.Bin253]|jgi:uncharacterized protein YebE (UPF0316 family)|nr:DUF2179 domain-containing protein [Candidatus Pacearchaeota archaeon]OQA67411.1 MAG: hypothetical protein BWY36_00712 [Candidatus Diapherotrites archaeon ADurb.Bin253]HOF44480.1 DUF2179 domain-containing protein [Candidatus Pacearchaeota archaeon]HOH04470.1 DUF2179 domain-containing protein [Candidatus Pacearchaeota archaeon]HOR52412.1 DUF2179 domain-containing protein [Candidatus Pacearchaeota archaeon]
MGAIFSYVVLPLLIFFARIADVSLGTIRIIFISKGFKVLAFLVGFFEVLIWLLAINQIWSDFSNPWLLLAYAAGFATGNYVGIYLDEKISIGNSMIRIIVIKNSKKLVNELKKNGYQLTVIDGHSADQNIDVKMILVVVKRKELKNVLKILKKINPNSFFTIEDIRNVRKNRNELLKEKRSPRRLFK